MADQVFAGWCFVFAGLFLLVVSGSISLISVLVPVSLFLAGVSLVGCDRKTGLSRGIKKG